jgi:transcriptional regulator with XRE-family HTH domain
VCEAAGLSQDALPGRVGTSRTAVSAYEHGRKSPSLDTVEGLLGGAGYELGARVYELVLRQGSADDQLRYIDRALLVDLWDGLVLPREVRAAWAPLIQQILAPAHTTSVA